MPCRLRHDDGRSVGERLQKLLYCGKPPFSPDTYIDVYIDDDDRIHLELDQSLGNKPVRLSAPELFALSFALRSFQVSVTDPLSDVAMAVFRKLDNSATFSLEELRDIELDRVLQEQMGANGSKSESESSIVAIREGIKEQRKLLLRFRRMSPPMTIEEVEITAHPYDLVPFCDIFHLLAFDESSRTTEIINLASICGATLLHDRYQAKEEYRGIASFATAASAGAISARIHFAPAKAASIAAQWPDHSQSLPDGGLMLDSHFPNVQWLMNWVLSFGIHAEVLHPPELRSMVATHLQEALQNYA